MMKNAALTFLVLSLVGLIGWVVVRFTRPIFGVSVEGFMVLVLISLGFTVAISLTELAFPSQKKN